MVERIYPKNLADKLFRQCAGRYQKEMTLNEDFNLCRYSQALR